MGGVAPDGNYYGPDSLAPGDREWLDPREAPLEVEEVPLDDAPNENDRDRTQFTEPYSGIVGGINYKDSKRPGTDPYDQTHGKLSPKQMPCLPPPDGCGAAVGEVCSFELAKVTGMTGQRKRSVVTGKRHMPCVSRIKRADAS